MRDNEHEDSSNASGNRAVLIDGSSGSLVQIRAAFRVLLVERAAKTQKVLFEGRWLTADEVERQYGTMQRRSGVIVVELLVLYLILIILAYIPILVLAALGGL